MIELIIKLIWPATILLCFFQGCNIIREHLSSRLKTEDSKKNEDRDKIEQEITILKLALDHTDDRFNALEAEKNEMKNDLNSIKLARGFSGGV